MHLHHIDISKLTVSPANMRGRDKKADIADILPSVRARGVLVPLLVRQNGSPDSFEIVAGRRRFEAARTVAEEGGSTDPLPCAVIEASDDAAALEASLIENLARLDPDEVTQWETFTRLVREGRSPADIAATFGLSERMVARVLALGNLHPRIRQLYAREKIDGATVRHLTLAPLARQHEWLALFRDPEARAPTGHQLKAWLFGGQSIPTSVAIFDLADYPAPIVSDLFGEEKYFSDADAFWTLQNAAVEAKAESYRAAGWAGVEIVPPGTWFHRYEHAKVAKAKGGKVFITLSSRGEVEVHEGWLTAKEAKRLAHGETAEDAKPARPEISAAIQSYIDLHRHAAVRAALAVKPSLALRVMVAHAIVGSGLWQVRIEPQRAHSDAIAESVENAASEAAFDEKRRVVLALLGFDSETPTVTRGFEGDGGIAALVAKLIALPDVAMCDVLAIVMAETLEAATPLIEMLGQHLAVDMAKIWQADEALLDAIRDSEVLDAVLAEVAGEEGARANAKATGKVKRGIIRDCLTGENGRAKVEGWVPRWMAFPPSAYTARGGVGTMTRAASLAL